MQCNERFGYRRRGSCQKDWKCLRQQNWREANTARNKTSPAYGSWKCTSRSLQFPVLTVSYAVRRENHMLYWFPLLFIVSGVILTAHVLWMCWSFGTFAYNSVSWRMLLITFLTWSRSLPLLTSFALQLERISTTCTLCVSWWIRIFIRSFVQINY